MSTYVAISKDPRWIKLLGAFLLIPGVFALIPFKSETIQMFDYPFFAISFLGLLLFFRANQRIGWQIILEDNIIYYSKFNLYSSWKKRRSSEFALSIEKINDIEVTNNKFIIVYDPSRHLTFDLKGLRSYERLRLEKLKYLILDKRKAH